MIDSGDSGGGVGVGAREGGREAAMARWLHTGLQVIRLINPATGE